MIASLKLPVSVLDGRGNYLGALVWPGDLLNGGGQLLSPVNMAKSAWVCVLVENGYRDRHERELAWGGRLKLLPEQLFYVNLALFKEFIVVLPLANSKISTCIQG
ncbi:MULTISPECIES: hypothetical protein [Shewanella]|uniref:hypothetical protein n=1 Tax=Shewanella TaxID=22 RepID=UPI0008DC9A9D|nr:hypothetical protein [Shewanella algae]MBO2612426.1 hypothetical protein [Shewanella algae]MBO2662829.1 hypothetical protein [Shewanella algae]MBO2688329.1 hypothetical protein [Shewanella algae]MCL1053608.1 hypothetical protein [Shewanella algae]OHY54542.1 hypothetical protein BEH76_17455 [Shewanella algae]